MSDLKALPVRDRAVMAQWTLNKEQADAVNDGKSKFGCWAWMFIVGAVLWAGLAWLINAFFADVSAEWRWGPSIAGFILAGFEFIRWAIGKTAYLHLCDGKAGALDVQVLWRREAFSCPDCMVGRPINGGVDDRNLVIVALSGLYLPGSTPTRILKMRFHPSQLCFNHAYDSDYHRRDGSWLGEGPAPMYAQFLFSKPVPSDFYPGEREEISLGTIMGTREDLRPHLIYSCRMTFDELVRVTVQAEMAGELLAKTHNQILATSRFGRSKEAEKIREELAHAAIAIYQGSGPAVESINQALAARVRRLEEKT